MKNDATQGADVLLPFAEREFKDGKPSFAFSSSVSWVDDKGKAQAVDREGADKQANFVQNYKYWNQETAFLSTNNIDNSYFQSIVNMGVDAVPYILEELKKGPNPLVHALDRIFPGVMKYEGFVSLKDACEKWIAVLE